MRSSRGPARTLPAASQMRAAPNPRTLTGWSGASSHVLRFPRRAFLRFPVCPPGSSPSSAFLWFPVVRRSPVRSLRPLPGSGSPSVSLRAPFPLSNLHSSAAARRFRRRRSRAAGTKVSSNAAPSLDRVIRPHSRWAAAGHDGMPPQNRLLRAAASAGHRRPPNRPDHPVRRRPEGPCFGYVRCSGRRAGVSRRRRSGLRDSRRCRTPPGSPLDAFVHLRRDGLAVRKGLSWRADDCA